ncbi:MAG: peroxiredoxin [Gemmataceae bacterium]|nr:peroxiredoxin [Gemmataceae bacterium]MCS7271650.1 peroxiredoxin [Gemmataceae bacterium]MDW8244248.1 peroxiredoxin [Thermogemmata sp.]
MPAQVQKEAPNFTATAVVNEQFKTIQLSDYRGKYVVLFFYPLDFTFVCPTEIIAFNDRLQEFHARGAEVLGCSIDSQFSHLAWIRTPREEGGLGGLKYPLIADLTKQISRDYGVLLDSGVALRGTFIIDRQGIIRAITIHDLPLGRSVDETLRVLDALQFYEQHGEVCPAEWHKGQPTIKPDVQASKEYFRKVATHK